MVHFIVLFFLPFASALPSRITTAKNYSNPMETTIDLNTVTNNGHRSLETSLIIKLSARDLDRPKTLQEHTYFLEHNHVRYTCTAAFASLCPKMFGGAWIKTNLRVKRFANATNVVNSYKLTEGGLEYVCFTALPRFCPKVPGGVWQQASNVSDVKKTEKGRVHDHELPTVTCVAKHERLCRNIKTQNDVTWVFKRHRNRDTPGQWMMKINNAELFCNASNVESCPFHDGEWLRVPSMFTQVYIYDFGGQNSTDPQDSTLHGAYREKEKGEETKLNKHKNNKSTKYEGEKYEANSKEKESRQGSKSNIFKSESFQEGRVTENTANHRSSNREHEFGYVKHTNYMGGRSEKQSSETVEEGWGKYTYKLVVPSEDLRNGKFEQKKNIY